MTIPLVSQSQKNAHAFIREKILSGEYLGGMWLKPHVIADELHMSRMPVREALRGLEMEGLVTIRPNKGATVTELTVEEVNDLFEIRANLEAIAAKAAVEYLTPAAAREVRRLQRAMDSSRSNTHEWIATHNTFHDYISSMSGRKRLAAEIQRSRILVQPYIRLYIDVYGTPELPAFEHDEIVEALLSKKLNVIDEKFRSHVMQARERILKFLENHYRYLRKTKAASRISKVA